MPVRDRPWYYQALRKCLMQFQQVRALHRIVRVHRCEHLIHNKYLLYRLQLSRGFSPKASPQ
mgnify:CR=1 FL=1